ncbi:E3 ubiquitin-protein ligase TRIM39-like [Trematomus bernacchii]|uniref:E3 ubiquitin-protein ligase TRIM39-like n=1 Tax=Trematomus bernacchii TaxID=40690 RepID=UPI00146F56C9|nr:E3 ubiquitin-protein ligase TRIM39-like [Trematomus bernacchii]
MSAASCLLTEDQFLCSICLDCQCPNCKEDFDRRPELRVNTFISEMAAQFRQSAQQEASSSSSEQQVVKPGEAPCDVCTGTRLKALKSCLKGLKRHQLIDPVENLEGRMCVKHDKLLELFCKTDQVCVCMLCTYSDHKTHDVVPLKEGYEGKKAELGKTEADIQQMIQKRRLKIQETKRSVELSKEGADREIADGVQVFTALKELIEKSQAELIDMVKRDQRLSEEHVEGFIKDFTSLNAALFTHDSTDGDVFLDNYEYEVRTAVDKLFAEFGLMRVQRYEVDVTLDPDTAHPGLILSDDGKQVKLGNVRKNVRDDPERFNKCANVLAKQSFSSGRFYYEVQVKGNTDWTLGVVGESIDRKGDLTVSPENGFWML